MVTYVCMALVGAVFLGTGTIKSLDARQFLRQATDYQLLPRAWAGLAALGFIGLECLIGAALLLHLSDLMIPVVMALLVFLMGLTIWGTSTGRVEDCGCYGGFLRVTPWQSILLDTGYLGLLGLAWFLKGSEFNPAASVSMWKLAVVAAAATVAVAIAWWSMRRGPLVNFSLLKAGKRWNPGWLKNSPVDLENGSQFVVFLSQDCPYCKQWVPFLNVIEVQPDLPHVLGLMSLDGSEKEAFLAQHMILFPIGYMSRGLMSMMVDGYPTAALVENGTISEKWFGEMPKIYVERIRQFYESISTEGSRTAKQFMG